MCGILGVWSSRGGAVSCERLRAAHERVAHRGPDDIGFAGMDTAGQVRLTRRAHDLEGSTLALGHRRLSILDLTEGGWQPMATPDGRFVIVYNGEIYNYLELRRELEARGVAFRSRSDTEVLLHAYAAWGAEAFTRLIGMFALAIVDTVARRVVLARDFFGIKPLYYAARDGGFAFASEIKAVLELGQVRRVVNAGRLHAYLRSGAADVGEETLFADVRQLPPGHFLELSLDSPTVPPPRRFWRVDASQTTELTFADAAERLRELFLDSIRLHLRSDVPVGAALSGGIDSSAIVAAMRHVEPTLELHTFSFAADDPTLSEEAWVDIIGRAARSVVHKVRPTAHELVADLDTLIAAQDEPFTSTSIYAQYRVFRLARETGIKVMLDGQGADEMLAGYPYFIGGRLGALIRRGRWMEARRFYGQARRLPHVRARTLLMNTGDALFPERLRPVAKSVLQQKRSLATDWLNERWFHDRGVAPSALPRLRGQSLLREQLAYSLEHGLPPLLRYEDRNSMAHSIESRVPFLTPQIAGFLFSLPDEYIISRDGVSKSVFRAAMRGIVPDAILDRRDKIGFQTPEQTWLATLRPWVDAVLRGEAARAIPALNHTRVHAEWADIAGGRRPFDSRAWRWINLIRWAELNGATFA
jgi:asparagine synthase (glutamine-hydrolysing)